MKIKELEEAIKGWTHAHSDLARMRAARAAASHHVKLVRLKKDGTESAMHDAVSTYPTQAAARARHADLVKLNPGRNMRHNLYVDNKLVQMLDEKTLAEVSHKVGAAAHKALAHQTVTATQQQALMHKFKQLVAKEQELASRPDSATGKYAQELMNLSRQKIKVARAGNLNAFGEPLSETATSGGTSAGAVANVANPFGIVIKRPSLFGYVSTPKKPSHKSGKKT